jgi:hypothetical protein
LDTVIPDKKTCNFSYDGFTSIFRRKGKTNEPTLLGPFEIDSLKISVMTFVRIPYSLINYNTFKDQTKHPPVNTKILEASHLNIIPIHPSKQ